jgi:hypothetical protein
MGATWNPCGDSSEATNAANLGDNFTYHQSCRVFEAIIGEDVRMAGPKVTDSRAFWTAFEPYHAITYFAPECEDAFAAIGLRGFWRGYFAGRAAPLGSVGPGVVVASFYGFHPAFVARAVPSVWALATPSAALAARLEGVDKAVTRLLPDLMGGPVFGEGARLLRAALGSAHGEGRPLFSANSDLDWPDEPHLALWHGTTLAREHRGDGHIAAMTARGIDACEAHLLKLAVEGNSLETIRPYRGWLEDDWDSARERLCGRGWLDQTGMLTSEGRHASEDVETVTDRLATEPLASLNAEQRDRLLTLLVTIARRLRESNAIP